MWFKTDVSALDDPRIALLGVRLGVSQGDAFHACSRVWAWLYQRGPGVMTEEEVNAVGRYSGLASELVFCGLAEATPQGLRIKGDERAKKYANLRALQKAKSVLGVEARAANSVTPQTIDNPAGHPRVNPVVNPVVNPCMYLSEDLDLPSQRPSQKESQNPDALDLARYLLTGIQTHTPGHRGNPERWARDIDLALRIDGRTPEQLRSVVDYAHRNPDGAFWAGNLLSGAKLRKHAERLLITLRRAPRSAVAGGNDGGRVMTADELAAWSLEQMRLERERGER